MAITNYIAKRIADPADAEDLTSQVFVKAMAAAPAAIASPSGYLFRIAHNLIIDHYRTRDRRPIADLDEALDYRADEDPARAAVDGLDGARLRQAIERLHGEQATVVRMRLDGYALSEIAHDLNKKVGAVKALYHRGVEALRRLLTPVRIRVLPGELTCTGCGEVAVDGYCPRCAMDDDGRRRKSPPPLVPSLSYLRDGEYYVAAL